MKNDTEASKSVRKTMQMLELLARVPDTGVTELSNQLAIHKSTTYRFLQSLCTLGYVRQNPDNERYSVTLKLFELGTAAIEQIGVWTEAYPLMEQLAQKTGETVHLATLDDGRLVYLHKIESTQTLRVSMMSRVGQSAPLHCTGLGKCLLAFSPSPVRKRIVETTSLNGFTSTTITSKRALIQELDQIRSDGFAFDNEEHELGVRCIAAPIWTSAERIAALSVSVPSVRLPKKTISPISRLVVEAAAEISSRLTSAPDPQTSSS